MKTKSVFFLAMFSFMALLLLGSCTKETREAVDCIRNPNDCPYEDDSTLEPEGVIEVDSTATVSELSVAEEEIQ